MGPGGSGELWHCWLYAGWYSVRGWHHTHVLVTPVLTACYRFFSHQFFGERMVSFCWEAFVAFVFIFAGCTFSRWSCLTLFEQARPGYFFQTSPNQVRISQSLDESLVWFWRFVYGLLWCCLTHSHPFFLKSQPIHLRLFSIDWGDGSDSWQSFCAPVLLWHRRLQGADQRVRSLEDPGCRLGACTWECADDDETVPGTCLHFLMLIRWKISKQTWCLDMVSLNKTDLNSSDRLSPPFDHRLPRTIGNKHIVKFSDGPCAADAKTDSRRSDRSCSSGIFLELVKQPRLGLLHQQIDGGELKLLHAFAHGCHAEYSLICREGVFEVKARESCASCSEDISGKVLQFLMGWLTWVVQTYCNRMHVRLV